MKTNLEAGDTIKAGTIVLITGGVYSEFGVVGIFRAITDVIVPVYTNYWGRENGIDIHKLSTMLEELDYVEAWNEY